MTQTSRQLEHAVRSAYSAAAECPNSNHPFPIGRLFAESVGYPSELLDSLPPIAYEGFTGVSCISLGADLHSGDDVLDLGCGAGLDALIAGRRVGERGSVTGVDFSDAMLVRARRAATESNIGNVEFHLAEARRLPLDDASCDAALVNGIFNLNPARVEIFSELARVVRPGGRVWGAELILTGPIPTTGPMDASNWFS